MWIDIKLKNEHYFYVNAKELNFDETRVILKTHAIDKANIEHITLIQGGLAFNLCFDGDVEECNRAVLSFENGRTSVKLSNSLVWSPQSFKWRYFEELRRIEQC